MINRLLGPNIIFNLSAYDYSSRVLFIFFVQTVLSTSVIFGVKTCQVLGVILRRACGFYVAFVHVSLVLGRLDKSVHVSVWKYT